MNMASHLGSALYLTLPLVIGGSLHMAAVRADVLSVLTKPIHDRAFGANKTWRGAIVMPLATVLGVALAAALAPFLGTWLLVRVPLEAALPLGTLLGLAYIIAELPNSFLKRRLGILPGRAPDRHRQWFVLADQTDSVLGCVLVYGLWLRPPALTLLLCVLLGPAVHLGANVLLYTLRLRREAV